MSNGSAELKTKLCSLFANLGSKRSSQFSNLIHFRIDDNDKEMLVKLGVDLDS